MLESRDVGQDDLFVSGSLRDLIPDDYILRQVDRVIDLSWVRAQVSQHYNLEFGRPGIDPEAALRLMLAGFFLGIVHDRRLMREAQMHLGIRWFAGYKLHEKLPDHSSLSRIRGRWGEELFHKLFSRVVQQCIDAKLVSGETVHVDATLIEARLTWAEVARRHAQRTLEENDTPSVEETAASQIRGNKRVFGYKQHTAVDSQQGIVVDCHITPANHNEGQQLGEQVQRIESTLGANPKTLTADAGYSHAINYELLEQRNIEPMIVVQERATRSGEFPVTRFKYDEANDLVRCPQGKKLHRTGHDPRRPRYRASTADCSTCPLNTRCLPSHQQSRTVTIVPGYTALLRARRKNAQTSVYERETYGRHRWQVEGRHAEAKTLYSLGRAVRIGIAQLAIQAYLTAVVMNLKRLARANPLLQRLKMTLTVAFAYLTPLRSELLRVHLLNYSLRSTPPCRHPI